MKMKRKLLLMLLSVVFLSGCATMTSMAMPEEVKTVTPLIPGPYPTPRIPPEGIYYRKRCWPACHYNSDWVSKEPPRLTFEFEDELGAGWTWVNEDPSHWSLSQSPDALRVTSQTGSILAGDAKNILLRDAPPADFDIITKVEFHPSEHFQKAGLFVEMEGGGVLYLSRGYCGDGEDPACPGNGAFLKAYNVDCDDESVPTAEAVPSLMLRKAGNYYVGYVRSGEKADASAEYDWVEVGRCYQTDIIPAKVGLAVTNGNTWAREIPADFSFFTVVDRE